MSDLNRAVQCFKEMDSPSIATAKGGKFGKCPLARTKRNKEGPAGMKRRRG